MRARECVLRLCIRRRPFIYSHGREAARVRSRRALSSPGYHPGTRGVCLLTALYLSLIQTIPSSILPTSSSSVHPFHVSPAKTLWSTSDPQRNICHTCLSPVRVPYLPASRLHPALDHAFVFDSREIRVHTSTIYRYMNTGQYLSFVSP